VIGGNWELGIGKEELESLRCAPYRLINSSTDYFFDPAGFSSRPRFFPDVYRYRLPKEKNGPGLTMTAIFDAIENSCTRNMQLAAGKRA
jgi:hypothetical protein